MKNQYQLKFLISFSVLFFTFSILKCNSQTGTIDNLKYVDPQIGGIAPFLQPTRTRIHIPNSMVRVYPERKDYRDDQIRSFPLNMMQHRSNPLFNILPVSGDIPEKQHPVSAWDKELEVATPFYYATWLEDFNITVEYSPSERAGFYRFNYGDEGKQKLFLRKLSGENWILNADGALTGTESFHGMHAYAYGVYDVNGQLSREGDNTWISFSGSSGSQINFKYGVSFISIEQAKINLEKEIPDWDFEKVKNAAREKWSSVINQIQVEGGTEAYKRTFYTALYRSYERMVNISEGNRYYSNYDGKIHMGERDFYVDDWCWDTYLALHPLRYILRPELEADMISSYIRMYEQSGWLPQFPQVYGDARAMNGFHSTVMILDAWRKGIRNFDINTAYEAMKHNYYKGTRVPWRTGASCELDDFYHKEGYFPALHPGEKETVPQVDDFEKRQAVAVTLEHSFDDWALAEMAKELNKTEESKPFAKSANNFKKLYWKDKGFFMPKDKDGKWINIDPKFDGGMGGRDYYDENNGWTYLWKVHHDIPALMELMGGKEIFEQRLDQLFREDLGRSTYALNARFPDFTGIVGQFSMGNEPSFHIPYLYNLTDSPWKTQKKIRMLLNIWFKDNEHGIPGDEDGGGMSAFVVFSAMGFYPVTPGIPVYTIGSPLFSKITLNLTNGNKFVVSAPECSEKNKYILSAKLNGKELISPWFTHEELMNGGTLELEMGAYPNKQWGRGTEGVPEYFKTN